MRRDYTPGPWVVADCAEQIGGVETGDGVPVAHAEIVGPLRSQCPAAHATRRANAKLIAAAPELAEALIQSRAALTSIEAPMHIDQFQSRTEAIRGIRAALRKAGILTEEDDER